MRRLSLFALLLAPLLASAASPTPEGVATTDLAAASGPPYNYAINMPSTVSANATLAVCLSIVEGGSTVSATWDTGYTWTALTSSENGTSAIKQECKATTAVGDEDSGTINVALDASEDLQAVAWSIPDAAAIGTSPPEGTATGGGSATPDPASLSPSGGSDDYLWLVHVTYQFGDKTFSGYSSGYSGTGELTAGNAAIGSGYEYKQSTASSEDPGTLTLSGSRIYRASTIALYPSAATPPSFTSDPALDSATSTSRTYAATSDADATWYEADYAPGHSAPADCDAVIAHSGAVAANSTSLTASMEGTVVLTPGTYNLKRVASYGCLDNAGGQSAVKTLTDVDRSDRAGYASTVLTSLDADSPYVAQTISGCDTTNGDPTIDGCGTLDWLAVGAILDASAGWSTLTDLVVTTIVDPMITFFTTPNADETDITLTQGDFSNFFSSDPAIGDIIEYKRTTTTGFEAVLAADGLYTVDYYSGTHDGGDSSASLGDSTEAWITDEFVGYTVEKWVGGMLIASGTIASNTATAITATLSGSETWDDGDTYKIVPPDPIAAYQKILQCIEDDSNTGNGVMTKPGNCYSSNDYLYVNDTAPTIDDDFDTLPLTLYVGEAMTSLDLTDYCTHDNNETLTFSVPAANVPSGTTLTAAGAWSGTPDTEAETLDTLNIWCQVPSGLVSIITKDVCVTDDAYTMPDLTGDTVAAGETAMAALRQCYIGDQLVATYGYSDTVAVGDIISQSIAAMDTVDATEQVSVVESLGPADITTNGLVLYLEADIGVVANGSNVVSEWDDQSGSGNDLTASGDPTLVSDVLNGHPVIDFDGVGDVLSRTSGVADLPTGSGDRTVYLVANYRGTGYGGFAFGTQSTNQTFGLVVDPSGDLMIQGWGAGHDFDSGVPGTGEGWLVQSAILSSDELTHYSGCMQIDARTHTYNTALSKIMLGAEIDGDPNIDMQVAAVIVYDRALTTVEQQQVLNYLTAKYQVASACAPAKSVTLRGLSSFL